MSKLAEDIVDGKNTRSNVRLIIKQLEDYSVRGIPVPTQLVEALPIVCARLLKSDSPRIQSTAVKLIMAMLKHNLELAQTADRMTRLDNDQPTERLECPIKLIGGVPSELFADERKEE